MRIHRTLTEEASLVPQCQKGQKETQLADITTHLCWYSKEGTFGQSKKVLYLGK